MMLYREFQTQADLDAQYNAAKLGIDIPAYINFYATNSAKARSEMSCHLNVPYGPTLAEHVDIFPAAKPNAPILVFIHGGYWVMLSSKEFHFVAQGPVSADVTVVVVNYALCPQVTIDEIVRQNRAAIAWIYRNAQSFGGDPNSIYVSGHSAGGHLTAMAMATDWENHYGLPNNIVKGGCAISGLFDLMPFPYTWLQPSLQLSWEQALRNSPIRYIPSQAGKMIVTHGSQETSEFHRQSQEFIRAWQDQGLEGEYLPQPKKNHFTAIDGFLHSDSLLCSSILSLMNRTPTCIS